MLSCTGDFDFRCRDWCVRGVFWAWGFFFKVGASQKETQVFKGRDKSQGISNAWYLEQSSVYTFAFK